MITCSPLHRIFYKEENGYTVMLYLTENDIPEKAICETYGKEHSFKATGIYLPDTEELTVKLEGEWVDNDYGMQLRVTGMEILLPKTREGMIGYLSSGLIRGVGPVIAARIVDMFGKDTFRVMKEEPVRLLKVRGITEAKLSEIVSSFEESSTVRELMAYLAPYKVMANKVKKIQEHFGNDALGILKKDPYRLTEISGMSFQTVDPIARKVNRIPAQAYSRMAAGIRHVLREAETEGHLYLDADEVVQHAANLFLKLDGSVSEKMIRQAGNRMVLMEHELSADHGAIYLNENLEDETEAARHIVRLVRGETLEMADISMHLERAQKLDGIRLGDKQKEAVMKAFQNPVSIITGGPGRGKTTVLRTILRIFKAVWPGRDALLCAPTGRAGRRMMESTGHAAMTIHKALYLNEDSEDRDDYSELISEDFVIVDESTMVDMHLARILFSRIRSGSRLILVGDVDQLPSVRPGNVFRELIESGVIPVTELDVGYRQKNGSRIIKNADLINSGRTCLEFGSDFKFIKAQSPEDAAKAVRDIYRQVMERMGKGDGIQVISPVKNQEQVGTYALNAALREMLNPPLPGQKTMKYGTQEFRVGDKVIQVKNRDEITNGDIGVVEDICLNEENKPVMSVLYSEDRCQWYKEDELELLQHAYAITVHKSQGSEYPVVIMPVMKQFYRMLKRNVLYTGVTRASGEVYLIGSTAALIQAIHSNDIEKRNTKLAERVLLEMKSAQEEEAARLKRAA